MGLPVTCLYANEHIQKKENSFLNPCAKVAYIEMNNRDPFGRDVIFAFLVVVSLGKSLQIHCHAFK